MPTLTIVAGANGAGKSTLTRSVREIFQDSPMLDPDAVARAVHITCIPDRSAIDAGKTILRRIEDLLAKQESFLVETTLSGNTYLRIMERAAALGYQIRLIYIGTESVEINMQRIRERVQKGGHDVPVADQQRRYPRSLANLPRALELADEAILFDNSSPEGHRKVALKDVHDIEFLPPIPAWMKSLTS